MAAFAPESREKGADSYHRFWSGMWLIRNHYGRIDDAVLRNDIAASHSVYGESGQRTDAADDGTLARRTALQAHSAPTQAPSRTPIPWALAATRKPRCSTSPRARSGGCPSGRATTRNGT